MIRYAIVATALSAAVFAWAASAFASDATYEKCTCDLKDPRMSNGASVRNATACWSTNNPNKQWCDISVQAIKGDGRQQSIINQLAEFRERPSDVVGFLQMQAAEVLDSAAFSEDAEFASVARDSLPHMLKQYDKLAAECVNRFLQSRESRETAERIDEGEFSCSVGQETGWLRMSFRIGERYIVFMLAPQG